MLSASSQTASNRVSRRSGRATAPGPVRVKKLAARLVDALVSVRAEVIALSLQQVGGQTFAAVAVEKSQRRAERRHRDPFPGGGGDDRAPAALALPNGLLEEGIQQQVGQPWTLVEG